MKKLVLCLLVAVGSVKAFQETPSIGGTENISVSGEEISRGIENKSFNNVRVYNTLHAKDVFIDEDTVIAGNLRVDGVISGGSGVSGPGSSTQNAVARFTDATGSAITDSPVLIDNAGNVTGANNLTIAGDLTGVNNITMSGDLTGANNIAMTGDLTGVNNLQIVNDATIGNDLSVSGTLYLRQLANLDSPSAVVTWPTTVGAAGTFLGSDGAGNLIYATPAGAGDVSAAANFTTNNRIVLTDTPSGSKNIKESTSVTIDGSDNISGVNTLSANTVTAPTLNGTATTAINALNVGTQTAAQVQSATIAANNATNANTLNRIVLRDGVTGGFSAGAITATQFNGPLNGNATSANSALTAGTATNFSGSLAGDVSGTQGSTVVNSVGGKTAAQVATSVNDTTAKTHLNTPSTLVFRDPSGNFFAGTITATQFSGPLSGNVTGNLTGTATSAVISTTAQWFSQNLAGDVTGPQLATTVAYVGAKTAAEVAQSVDDTQAATENNTASTIVKRDGSGHFDADSITIVSPPTADTDATNKEYVDSVASGLRPKTPVLVTSIINTTTFGLGTVDSVLLSAADRVLLTQQAYQVDNGIWLAQSSNWTRPTDFSIGSTAGQAYVLTTSGATLAGTGWLCNTPLAVVGTDTISFVQFTSAGQTTGANVGTGIGEVFRDKTGLTLNFKRLAGVVPTVGASGNFVSIVNGANNISFAVTATSDNTANSLVARDGSGSFAGSLTGAASLNVLKAGDTMTGNLLMSNQSAVRLGDSGSNYVGLRAPTTIASNYTMALPTQAPAAGQFLQALDATSLTWTTVDAPPSATQTIYVALNGDDSNDGSILSPLRTVSAAVTMANGIASLMTPVTISIGSGFFNETPPIAITARGISLEGSTLASTLIIQNGVGSNLFTVNSSDVSFSNLILRHTIGSTSTAINITAPDFGRTRIDNVGISLFGTGVSYNGTFGLPFLFIQNIQCTDMPTAMYLSNVQAIIRLSALQGSSTGSIANTGLILTGTSGQTAVFNSYFSLFDTAVLAQNGSHCRVLGSNFELTDQSILASSQARTEIIGCNFILNNPTTVNVTASGAGTKVYIEGCLFDCEDADDISRGTAIKVIDEATIVANASTIEQAEIGISCGEAGDIFSTEIIASGLNIIDTTTSLRQAGSSTLQFIGGTFDAENSFFEDTTNVNLTGFNINGVAPLSIGKGSDSANIVYELLNGQTNYPTLSYHPDHYGFKGTVYQDQTNNAVFNGMQADVGDAAYYVITGDNTKEASIKLISDSNLTNDPLNVRGWSITKLGTSGDLAFSYTNNDPGQADRGPYTVMQLDGFDNQVEFPLASGSLPTNLTAKLVWGDDTNLYRPAPNTLQTDGNFVVGGVLSAGSTFISTLTVGAGTPGNPSLQFAGSSGTGFSAQTANRLSFDTNSVERMSISSTGTIAINAFINAGVVHNNDSGQLSSLLIVNTDVSPTASIVDTKLATIITAGKVANSATTATSSLVQDTIVLRDASGNFLANIITATLSGNATTATSAITSTTTTYFTGQLFGDVTGLQATTSVALVGGKTSAAVAAATSDVELSTTVNTPNTLVRRNAAGDFAAGTITATLNGNAATATSAITSTTTTYFTGQLFGDVTGLQATTSVASIGGKTSAAVAAATSDVELSTTVNTPNTLVRRNASGSFAAGMITASLTGMVTGTASFNVLKIGDTMTGSLTLPAGSAAAPSLNFAGGTTTGLSMPSTNYLSLATNGIERMSIDSTGTVEVYGTFVASAGTAASPSIKFTNGINTGLSSAIANKLSLDTVGVERMSIDSTALITQVPVQVPFGSATTPAYTFSGDTNTGMYDKTADSLGFTTNGVERMSIDATGTVEVYGTMVLAAGSASQPSLIFTNGVNTGLSSAGTGTAAKISFSTNGMERMSILPTGTIVASAGFAFGNTIAQGALQVTTGSPITVNDNTSILFIDGSVSPTVINFPSPTMQGQLFTIVLSRGVNVTLTNNPTAPATTIVNAITNFNNTNTYQAPRARCSVTYIYYGTTWYCCGRG